MIKKRMLNNRKNISPDEAYNRLAATCSTREVSPADAADKLRRWGVDPADAQTVMERLVAEAFLSEERYARAFVHDKVCFERWGRLKIRQALQAKGIRPAWADRALAEVSEAQYADNLRALMVQKRRTLHEPDAARCRLKLMRFATGRGYLMEEIQQCLEADGDM